MNDNVLKLICGVLQGNKRALARSISLVENEQPYATELLSELYKNSDSAYRIGITGPPGAGKSTLTSELAKKLLNENKKVGIIAVDPTSPFSGGAVLGDRIRMNELNTHENIFIRSVATRGSLGGLSKATQDISDLMAAAGYDYILLETVGVGQGELDVARATDTTVVVLVPESGDGIQAMKAGLMEIADGFVINKSDRDGADKLFIELESALNLAAHRSEWRPPILKSIANAGKGIAEILAFIQAHHKFLSTSGMLFHKRKKRSSEHISALIRSELERQFWTEERKNILLKRLDELLQFELSPAELVKVIYNAE